MSTGKKVDKNVISHLTCTAQAHVLIFSCCSPAAVCWPEPEEGSGSYSSDQRPVLLAIARVSAVSVSAGGVSYSLSLSVSREVTRVFTKFCIRITLTEPHQRTEPEPSELLSCEA